VEAEDKKSGVSSHFETPDEVTEAEFVNGVMF
jgi:hypothetical protein